MLIVVGCSAGWMLSTDWMARFERVQTWDIDPLAQPLFAWRHGHKLRRMGIEWVHHQSDGMTALQRLTRAHPQALFWFDNVLGQLRFLNKNEQAVESMLRQLRHTLGGVHWGSVHDRLSGPANPPAGAVLPIAWHGKAGLNDSAPQTQAWLRQLHALSPWGDHLTREVFPAGTPTLNLAWAIAPRHHHWLEAGWVKPFQAQP
jgi:hypothetical protein